MGLIASDTFCEELDVAKHSSKRKGKSCRSWESIPMKMAHTDICYLITPATIGGENYFAIIIDDYSRVFWSACVKS